MNLYTNYKGIKKDRIEWLLESGLSHLGKSHATAMLCCYLHLRDPRVKVAWEKYVNLFWDKLTIRQMTPLEAAIEAAKAFEVTEDVGENLLMLILGRFDDKDWSAMTYEVTREIMLWEAKNG